MDKNTLYTSKITHLKLLFYKRKIHKYFTDLLDFCLLKPETPLMIKTNYFTASTMTAIAQRILSKTTSILRQQPQKNSPLLHWFKTTTVAVSSFF